jgi:hypothetical protein
MVKIIKVIKVLEIYLFISSSTMLKITTIVFILFVTQSHCFLRVKNNRIVNEIGAEFIFHGLNIVEKVPPYITHFN